MSDVSIGSNVEAVVGRHPNQPWGPYYCAGIPDFCWCGEEDCMFTSKSDKNPYRRFFRWERAATDHLVNDNHAFKWVDEAYYDELKLITKRIRKLEVDVNQKLLQVEEEILEVKEELKADIFAMKHASDIRIHEEVTNLHAIVNKLSEERIAMDRKWKKNLMILCGIFVITACII